MDRWWISFVTVMDRRLSMCRLSVFVSSWEVMVTWGSNPLYDWIYMESTLWMNLSVQLYVLDDLHKIFGLGMHPKCHHYVSSTGTWCLVNGSILSWSLRLWGMQVSVQGLFLQIFWSWNRWSFQQITQGVAHFHRLASHRRDRDYLRWVLGRII